MVVCKFYQAGRCRYGNNCKFEHIDPPGGARNNGSNDPFSTPNKRDKYRSNNKNNSEEEPQWPLSVIGLKENALQGNAVTGDWSPEELRAAAYSMAPRGVSNEVTQREAQLLSEHKAKVDAFNRSSGGQGQTSGGGGTQHQDPFAQNGGGGGGGGGVPTQQGQQDPFAQSDGGATQQGFGQPGQPFQQQPMQQPSQGGGAFGAPGQPPQSFAQPQGFSNPQQPPPTTQPPLTAAAQEQFSAAQFGFAKVPESAPPPQFY